MKHKYNIDDVKEKVKKCNSIRSLLKELNITPAGGNYRIINNFIKKNNIDISHFTGKGANKGKKLKKKHKIEKHLSNEIPIQSHKLRLRLIQEQVFKPVCSNCNLDTWMFQPIPLELDHINGNHQDNSLDNLRLLCPNCHAQTSNYRGKNKKA